MKTAIIAVVLLLGTARAGAHTEWNIDSACLTLFFNYTDPALSDSLNTYYNPDSVMVDTCSLSPYYGTAIIKRGIQLFFASMTVLDLPWAPPDTVLEVPWTAIDTSFPELRAGFKRIYDSIGPFVLRKLHPDDTNGRSPNSRMFKFRFFNYVPGDSVLPYLDKIPGIIYLKPEPIVPLGVVGSRGSNLERPITIFPQPASDFFYFDAQEPLPVKPSMIDAIGRDVINFKISSEDGSLYTFDISKLIPGLYFIRFNNRIVKVLVQR